MQIQIHVATAFVHRPFPLGRFILIPGFILNLRASEFSHGLLQYHWDSWCIATEQRKRQDCIGGWCLRRSLVIFSRVAYLSTDAFSCFWDYKNTSHFHVGEFFFFFFSIRYASFISIEWRSNESNQWICHILRHAVRWTDVRNLQLLIVFQVVLVFRTRNFHVFSLEA